MSTAPIVRTSPHRVDQDHLIVLLGFVATPSCGSAVELLGAKVIPEISTW